MKLRGRQTSALNFRNQKTVVLPKEAMRVNKKHLYERPTASHALSSRSTSIIIETNYETLCMKRKCQGDMQLEDLTRRKPGEPTEA